MPVSQSPAHVVVQRCNCTIMSVVAKPADSFSQELSGRCGVGRFDIQEPTASTVTKYRKNVCPVTADELILLKRREDRVSEVVNRWRAA